MTPTSWQAILARPPIERLSLGACMLFMLAGLAVAAAPGGDPNAAVRATPPAAAPAAEATPAEATPAEATPAAATPAAASPGLPSSQWAELRRPLELFSLSLPGAAGSLPSYRAERNLASEGRRDTLVFGSPNDDGPMIAIAVVRNVSPEADELSDTAQRLADGHAGPASEPVAMTTKFGDMASAELTITTDHGVRPCIAFGRLEEPLRFAVQGLYCAPVGAKADRVAARCAVDRLDLAGGGDAALQTYFASAEKRRNFCGTGDLRAGGSGRAYIDGGVTLPVRRNAPSAGPQAR